MLCLCLFNNGLSHCAGFGLSTYVLSRVVRNEIVYMIRLAWMLLLPISLSLFLLCCTSFTLETGGPTCVPCNGQEGDRALSVVLKKNRWGMKIAVSGLSLCWQGCFSFTSHLDFSDALVAKQPPWESSWTQIKDVLPSWKKRLLERRAKLATTLKCWPQISTRAECHKTDVSQMSPPPSILPRRCLCS